MHGETFAGDVKLWRKVANPTNWRRVTNDHDPTTHYQNPSANAPEPGFDETHNHNNFYSTVTRKDYASTDKDGTNTYENDLRTDGSSTRLTEGTTDTYNEGDNQQSYKNGRRVAHMHIDS